MESPRPIVAPHANSVHAPLTERRLREIEAAFGGFLRAEKRDVGVRADFEERLAAGHDEKSEQFARSSLAPQRFHRIHTRCSSRWQIRCEHAAQEQQRCRAASVQPSCALHRTGIRAPVVRKPRQTAANNDAKQQHCAGLPHHQPQQIRAVRAQRNPHAHLARSLRTTYASNPYSPQRTTAAPSRQKFPANARPAAGCQRNPPPSDPWCRRSRLPNSGLACRTIRAARESWRQPRPSVRTARSIAIVVGLYMPPPA